MNRVALAIALVCCLAPTAAEHIANAAPPSERGRAIAWQVVVSYPDHQKKVFEVTADRAELPLHSALWTCTVGRDADARSGGMTFERATLRCEDGRGKVSTSAQCPYLDEVWTKDAGLVLGGDGQGIGVLLTCTNEGP